MFRKSEAQEVERTVKPGNGDSLDQYSARDEARSLNMLIAQVQTELYRAREHELRPLGIPMMHSAVLWVLKVLDRPASPAEISRMILRRHQSVLQLLGRMEKQGYVTVQRGPRPGGPVQVEMTAKGKETAALAWEKEKVLAEIISSLSEEERVTLRALLGRLRDKATVIGARSFYT